MPTYEYSCDACGAQYELEQRISEEPKKKCQKCGKNKARRMITQGNFILKGSGWYADGYGSSGSGAPKAKSTESSKPEKSSKESTPSKKKVKNKASSAA